MERRPPAHPTLVTVGQLIARKRQADVLRAMWVLRDRHPDLRYRHGRRRARARQPRARWPAELGLDERVELTGALPHEEALKRGRDATRLRDAVDRRGVRRRLRRGDGRRAAGDRLRAASPARRTSPRLGHGMRLVPPGDPEALAAEIDHLLDHDWRRADRRGRPGDRRRALHLGRVRRGDRRRLRGGAGRVTRDDAAGPGRHQPRRRPTARARSRRCTRARASARACSAAARTTRPPASTDPGVPFTAIVGQRDAYTLAASGASARSIAGTAGRTALPAACARRPPRRASRSCCGPRSGRTRARPPSRWRGTPLLRRALPRRRRGHHLRPARQRVRARPAARATSTSRPRRSTPPSGARPAPPRSGRPARPSPRSNVGRAGALQGHARAAGGLALSGLGPPAATRSRWSGNRSDDAARCRPA